MKKYLILIIIVSLFLISSCTTELTEEELRQIVYSDINNYCINLKDQAKQSSCATCGFWDDYEQYISDLVFEIISENYLYTLTTELPLVYGRNTYTGSVEFKFVINKNGEIISKDLPERGCI